MSFDLSRISYNARNDFLGVVMQQGRVQLDTDWNEWVAELSRRLQAGTLDTFGGSVVPRTTPDGFAITATGGSLRIGPGRIYVDGILAENHGAPDDHWDPKLAELHGTQPLDYQSQPYYPEPPPLPEGGPHLVYVDVWQRDVTHLQAPELIEKAVGIDTTGRRQTVWQVKVLANVGSITCVTPDEEIPNWLETIAASGARLSTSTGTPDFEECPCQVPPAAGYRGLENQLYRVEVHHGGPFGTATFKWSRDNGSVATRVTHINPARDRITVESIGRDDVLRFNDGDWVEVTDDFRELSGQPGELRRIRVAGGVDERARTLDFEVPLSAGLFPTDPQQATLPARNTLVRRWDQSGSVRNASGTEVSNLDQPGAAGDIAIPASGTKLFLEHGILVEFGLDGSGGEFKTGDHWVFAARSVDASVEQLDQAPPLGTHHHYARLAVVEFPDKQTDCRKLWPPVSDESGCDCTVCVSAEGHNTGTATIQQAIDSIKATGGTLCLGIGNYVITDPLQVDGAASIRIRGQGLLSVLLAEKPSSVLEVSGSTGVALENFSVVSSASNADSRAAISITNSIDFSCQRINIVQLSAADTSGIGLALSGFVLGAKIHDSAFVAEVGIATVTDRASSYALTGELHAGRNVFFCSQKAVSFEGATLHFGNTRLSESLVLGGERGAIVATGIVIPGSNFSIQGNVIYTQGDGIQLGLAARVQGNDIQGLSTGSGTGIAFREGSSPTAVDTLRFSDNRLSHLGGDGISVSHAAHHVAVVDNTIRDVVGGAFVMKEDAAAAHLELRSNHCEDLGPSRSTDGAFVGIQLIAVEHADVLDNSVGNVARSAVTSPSIDLLRASGFRQISARGNRFYGVGPNRGVGQVATVRLLPPFDHAQLDQNSMDRASDDTQRPEPAEWYAIFTNPEIEKEPFAGAWYFTDAKSAYLLTPTSLRKRAARAGTLSIRANLLRGQATRVPLNVCAGLDGCLFSSNECRVTDSENQGPQLGLLSARTVTASDNRLVATGDTDTLHLQPQGKAAIVMGNTSTGNIRVLGANSVPSDLTTANIIGF